MASFGGLLAGADLAADAHGRARQLPLVLHVRGEVRGQFDGAAVVAKDQLLVVVTQELTQRVYLGIPIGILSIVSNLSHSLCFFPIFCGFEFIS